MGSLAVATRGQWMTGVSTDISASFIKPGGKLGEEVFMESKVVGIGPFLFSSSFIFSEDRRPPLQGGPLRIREQSLEIN